MIISKELLEEMIFKSPLTLLIIKDEELIDQINEYLPYSIGMEFECYVGKAYNKNAFDSIPNILSVDIDSSEQRYRIPNGINGLLCLYNISCQLKNYSELDLGSSVHIHIDMTDYWKYSPSHSEINLFRDKFNSLIIEELKSWNTAINLTEALYGMWYIVNELRTLEIRIVEPTFDYDILIKRIYQACKLVKCIKDQLNVEYVKPSTEFKPKTVIEYIRNNLIISNSLMNLEITKKKTINTLNQLLNKEEDIESDIKSIIKNRTTKL